MAYRVDYDKINFTRMEFFAIQIAPVNAVKDRELIRKPVLEYLERFELSFLTWR